MTTPPEPTFMCRAWAAYKLIGEGRVEAAEDELAAAFGYGIQRIKRDDRLLCKLTVKDGLTDAERLHVYEEAMSAIAAQYPQFVPPAAPLPAAPPSAGETNRADA